ncbi:MAG: ABC transporter ATP-binding protein/permease [Bacilli bacterium]|nr:ABC transporter ATP-binding protein/permease [Bacilli bacterium]MDD4795003.1 ABC transporter ATP-binding protein/permease [Bacilli bacterium]
MIKIENVNKYFNRRKKNEIHVINNTTLSFDKTGLVALLGPSGCGKTTLLNVIGGLDKVNKGKIYINGERITKRRVNKIDKIRNLNIGYIFQDYKLVEDMSVFDNIALVLKMVGIKDKKEIKTRVDYVLETLNIYRYRNRPASMLSGGERQRVGIARAIVKDPDIIIADEPTGNLDSKNTLEIMNIIKSISKNRLVILVTHERNLAEFYASRIIEIKDGKIDLDYINNNERDLDYTIENNIYLKDFKNKEAMTKENINIDFYSDAKEKIDLDIVIKNGNFYIRSNTSDKIQIIDDASGIELLDEHYKKIDKSVYQKYEFNFSEIINKNIKKRYSSILNLFTLVINGFKKIVDYSLVRKLLLLGFLASSMFIMFSLSRIFGVLNIQDEDFVSYNKNYLQIVMPKIDVDDYLKYEEEDIVEYLLPGNSMVGFNMNFNDYYQTVDATGSLSGSLSSTQMITKEDLVYGNLPESEYEVVVDKIVITNMFNSKNPQQAGILKDEDLLNREITIPNMKPFKIVGITDLQSPSIYANPNQLLNIIANSVGAKENSYSYFGAMTTEVYYVDVQDENALNLLDYNLLKDEIKLKRGKWPENDYEIVVNYDYRYQMPLNKTIDAKINSQKLKVVGYYESKENYNYYLISPSTLKYSLINTLDNITVYAKDKEVGLQTFRDKTLNISDTYDIAKNLYKEETKDSVLSTLVVSGIILLISLIEIFLMIRSSFLSRIKEIGIFRAIGVKKSDIYKMFTGEIIAITSLACISGSVLMAYIIKVLTEVNFMKKLFVINPYIVGLSLLICFVFNLVVGIIPVYNTIRKTPAQILARHDLD